MLKNIVKAVASLLLVASAIGVGAVFWITDRTEGHYFDSDSVRLHYTVEGEGEPLVLLHGFAVNADLNWRLPGVTEALAREFRVIAMDLRGHGLSDTPYDPARYGIEMVEDVRRLLDHLGIEKAHVVGYSLGGIVTLKLATTNAERLLTASPLGAGWERGDNSAFLGSLEEIATTLEAGNGVPPLSGNLGDDRVKPGTLHTLWVKVMTRYLSDGRALAAAVRGLPAMTVEAEDLRQISVPVCSIIGSLDPLKAGVDAMRGLVPDHTVTVIDGADHLQAVRSPEFLDALTTFLRRHKRGGIARP